MLRVTMKGAIAALAFCLVATNAFADDIEATAVAVAAFNRICTDTAAFDDDQSLAAAIQRLESAARTEGAQVRTEGDLSWFFSTPTYTIVIRATLGREFESCQLRVFGVRARTVWRAWRRLREERGGTDSVILGRNIASALYVERGDANGDTITAMTLPAYGAREGIYGPSPLPPLTPGAEALLAPGAFTCPADSGQMSAPSGHRFYPPTALEQEVQGWVILGFELLENGTIENPRVLAAAPQGIFDQAALDILSYTTYAPVDSPCTRHVKFSFRLE